MTRRDYIIWAPNYVSSSAGIRCLYILCDRLRSQGSTAYITGSNYTTPKLDAPLISAKTASQLLRSESWMAIYPEITDGNPLNAKVVARWVLNRPGWIGGPHVFRPSDYIFQYSRVYEDAVQNEIQQTIYIPTIDQKIFFPPSPETKRSGVAFYVGKSVYRAGFFKSKEAIEITSKTKRKDLGALFRHCDVLYCFDNSTILIYEAILCGCPVVVIPDGTQTLVDYQKLDLGLDGMAWGPENLESAKRTVGRFPETYDKILKKTDESIRLFIEKTAAWPTSTGPTEVNSVAKLEEADELLRELNQVYRHPFYMVWSFWQILKSKLL